jgi:hypothetical protein
MKRWQLITEAMLLAMLLVSAAVMGAEPLISVTGHIERDGSGQSRSAATAVSKETPTR